MQGGSLGIKQKATGRIEHSASEIQSAMPGQALMKLPYVIDNQTHILAEILKGLLMEHKGRSLDVATACFTVGRFELDS